MQRIFLFLATNFAVLLLVGIIFQLLGIEGILQENGVDMNLQALLVLSVVIGFGGSFFSLFMSKWLAKRSMSVQIIETPSGQAEQWLVDTVTRQAQQAGIGMPEVGIFNSPAPNAFATGANRNNSLVAVSTGLLENMNRDEVEAVLAHEVTHVANGDMVTLTLIQGIVNSFVIFFSRVVGHLVDRVVFKTERGYGPGYYIGSIVAQIIFSLLASMIVMWFSRRREFRADAGGAALAGRHKMIAALRRLQTAHDPEPLPDEMAAFGISGKVKSLFSSHPPLDERIIALENSTQ
ncbi:zinc metalloprotease HtpX [Solemya velum gill symbiont]|uniref:protease HtpX n=1 Tax=Solemya velum gill symbiont TaxID=2340 RepID=UPI0009983089|nr:protease HtpX [Solemya velum gill symbiont]OOZ16809.1 zinc metalloprotease HtpX [Solemya velum gill symbiont]OOZ26244.1 zinc metalloprotease HtpX [Solemya velum gill symbiont]